MACVPVPEYGQRWCSADPKTLCPTLRLHPLYLRTFLAATGSMLVLTVQRSLLLQALRTHYVRATSLQRDDRRNGGRFYWHIARLLRDIRARSAMPFHVNQSP